MKCTNFNIGKMIGRYEYDLLSPAEKQVFETHLLECDACFNDLYSSNQLVEIVQQHPNEILNVLKSTKRKTNRIIVPLNSFWQTLVPVIERILSPIPAVVRVAAGAVVVAVVVLLIILPGRNRFKDLVQLEPAAYEEFALRNQVSTEQQMFSEAMVFYQKKDYAAAILKLRQVQAKQPDFLAASFYLGVCLLLDNQPQDAAPYLQTVAQSGDAYYEEASNWYLANAYLLLGDVKQAQASLELVLRKSGSHRDQAQRLLEALKQK